MKLWQYQTEAVDFIGKNKKIYLAYEMGLGKTITSLAAARKYGKKHVLVIAEKNEIINSQNFRREIETNLSDTFYYVNLRKEIPWKGGGGAPGDTRRMVCGINPNGLAKLEAGKLQDLFDFVIVDEATMAKTTTTARFKMVRKICREMEYIVLLSGTPMMNGAAEIYAPLLLLGHPLAGDGTVKSRMAFESIFAGGHRRKIRNTGKWFQDYIWWAKGANHIRELRYLINDRFFFKMKNETGIFKEKVRKIENVPMTLPWLVEYKNAWDEYLVKARKREVNMENVMELQRLIENGQVYQVNSQWKAKKVVSDIAEGKYGNQRIVIFSMFIETSSIIIQHLTSAGISFRTFEELREWKAGNEQVLVGRIKVHGKGSNVSEASACLFVDMDFVPSSNLQSECRIDRPEQKNNMTVAYYLTEGDDVIDAHVRKINQDKARKIENFMRPLTQEEIENMPLRLNELRIKFKKECELLGI